jgi:hypothetical protein
MELIRFIFSDFLVFCGFCVLLLITFGGISDIVREIKRKPNGRDLHP